MSDDAVVALREVPLFRGMSDKALARVAEISKEVAHPDGKTVLEEDQSAVGFHLILSGEAEARHGGSVVNTMGPGDYFGEMSLIDGKPRSASVVAKGDLRTLAIPSWNFGRLLDENPDIMKALLVVMSDRIRSLRDAGEPGRG
jgi:CRP-like cAMP-binding protein